MTPTATRSVAGAATGPTRRFVLGFGGAAPLLGAACAAAGTQGGATPVPTELGAELTWSTPAATLGDEAEKVGAAFRARYPRIRIAYNLIPDAVTFYTYLVSSTAAGTPPDVMQVHTFVVPEHAERGILAPLDAYARRDRKEVDPDDWWPPEVAMITWKGKLYGLPWDFSNLGIAYNRSLFEQAGVPVPSDERWTWADVAALAQRFVRDEGGTRAQWGLLGAPPVDFWQTYGLVAADGGQVVSRDLKKSTWNSPQNVRWLQFFADLRQKARITPRPSDVPPGTSLWYAGRAAMTVMGSWATTAYRQGIGGNFAWDVLRFPFGGGGKRAVSAAGANGSVARLTKHPEAAWQWTKHYYSTESLNTMIAEPLRSIPGRKSSAVRWEQVAAAGGSRRSTRGPSPG